MCTDPAVVGEHCNLEGEDEVTTDGIISIVQVVIAALTAIYLFVALLDPERF